MNLKSILSFVIVTAASAGAIHVFGGILDASAIVAILASAALIGWLANDAEISEA